MYMNIKQFKGGFGDGLFDIVCIIIGMPIALFVFLAIIAFCYTYMTGSLDCAVKELTHSFGGAYTCSLL